jgi:tetratricopeptide (TPR) repeat protein
VVWILEKLSGPPDSDLAEAYINLAMLYSDQKQNSAAREYLQRAVAIWSRVLQPDHPRWINAWNTALMVAVQERKFDEAVTYIPRILDLAALRLGPDHRDMAQLLYNAGTAYAGAGMYEHAAAKLTESLELSGKLSEPVTQEHAARLTRYAQVLRKLHRNAEARAIETQAKELTKVLSAKR